MAVDLEFAGVYLRFTDRNLYKITAHQMSLNELIKIGHG